MANENEAPTEEASTKERDEARQIIAAAYAKAQKWAQHAVDHGDMAEPAFAHLYTSIILAKTQGSSGFEFVKLVISGWERIQVMHVEVDGDEEDEDEDGDEEKAAEA